MNQEQMLFGKYKLIQQIAIGSFGHVYLVEDKHNQQYALKYQSRKLDPLQQSQLEIIISRLKQMNSQHFMKLYDRQKSYHVLEYCNGGTLDYVQEKNQNQVFPLKRATQILSQVIVGIEQFHEKGYVHRNLKKYNIYLKIQDKQQIYKIDGLEFSTKLENSWGSYYDEPKWSDMIFNPMHKSPQILSSTNSTQLYGFQVDVWAFGVLFYFMINYQYPFNCRTSHEMRNKIYKMAQNFSYRAVVQQSKKKLFINCTPEMEDLFLKMFNPDPAQRIKFPEIKKHPVFAKYFSQQIFQKYEQIQLELFDNQNSNNPIQKKQILLEKDVKAGQYNALKKQYEHQLQINQKLKEQSQHLFKLLEKNKTQKMIQSSSSIELQQLKKQIKILKQINSQLSSQKFDLHQKIQFYQNNVLKELKEHVNTLLINLQNKDKTDVFKRFVPMLEKMNHEIMEFENQNMQLKKQLNQKTQEIQEYVMNLNTSEIIKQEIEQRNNYFLSIRQKLKKLKQQKTEAKIQMNNNVQKQDK